MTSPSWFRFLKLDFVFSSGKTGGSKPHHRPLRPLLSLEQLEDRMVPSAAAANVGGGVNNPTVNPNPQSIGVFLPPSGNFQQNPSALGAAVFPNAVPTSALGILAATQDQGHLYGQFRSVSVNSQGQVDPFILTPYTSGAYGFGSGTQPGQPWAPAAYNVGLANHQFSFSSNSDQGFQVPPPWSRSIDYTQENDGDINRDTKMAPLLGPAKATLPGEEEGREDESVNDKTGEISADQSVALAHPLGEQGLSNGNSDRGVRDETAPREEMDREAALWEEGFSYAVTPLPGDHHMPIRSDSVGDESEPADSHLGDLPTLSRSLDLSSLSPLQFSALLTGLAMSALQVKSMEEAPESALDELEEVPAA
jgi:hypothetical protein